MQSRKAPAPFDLGYRSVRSRQHCGVIALGREAIEVLPKIEVQGTSESDVAARIRLLSMLAFTRRLPVHQAEAARLATQTHALLEVFIRLYCTRALALVRAGMIHRYERQDDNLRVLRGKLVLPVHVPLNAARQDRVYCAFDEFTPDNAVNQIIKAAARRAASVTSSASTQGMLRELIYSLDEITDRRFTVDAYQAIPRDRMTHSYRDVVELAAMILFGPLPDVVSGDVAQVALLFDMNKLFEEFVGRHMMRLASTLSAEVELQGPPRWLGREITAGTRGDECFRLKPDITLRRGAAYIAVIDTKWKVLSSGTPVNDVSEADVYQMLAYMTRYNCPTGMLLYPLSSMVGEHGVISRIDVAGRKLILAGLDLSDIGRVSDGLERLLRFTVGA